MPTKIPADMTAEEHRPEASAVQAKLHRAVRAEAVFSHILREIATQVVQGPLVQWDI